MKFVMLLNMYIYILVVDIMTTKKKGKKSYSLGAITFECLGSVI